MLSKILFLAILPHVFTKEIHMSNTTTTLEPYEDYSGSGSVIALPIHLPKHGKKGKYCVYLTLNA